MHSRASQLKIHAFFTYRRCSQRIGFMRGRCRKIAQSPDGKNRSSERLFRVFDSPVSGARAALFAPAQAAGAFAIGSHKLLPAQQPADKRGKPQAECEREAQRAQCGGGAEQADRHLMHRADVDDDLAYEP